MTTFPNTEVTPAAAYELLDGEKPNIWYTAANGVSRYYLDGPMAPMPGIQDGIVLVDGLQGLIPDFDSITLKAARQDGHTWTASDYKAGAMTMKLQAHARTAAGLSTVTSEWFGSWDPRKPGKLEYWTLDHGYWWHSARLAPGSYSDNYTVQPRVIRQQDITQKISNAIAFWSGVPSTDVFPEFGAAWTGSGSGFLTLQNIGDQDGYPSILFYAGTSDGATLQFSNGPAAGTSTMISFGPLKAGQVALITTLPRLRGVVDLTPNTSSLPPTPSNTLLKFLSDMVADASYNSGAPMLAQYESAFGALPTQGDLYQLLSGFYTNPFPGVATPSLASPDYLAVSITGGNSATKVIGTIVPLKVSPE
ncbi:hypothetical protein E2F47_22280 [Mycobacterium eburneum]|nr:hypothetical protein [Mycobacterium eburneum]TDH48896.1 hypothetical protein E2F47_22280 [Mycobacterium eburneum]